MLGDGLGIPLAVQGIPNRHRKAVGVAGLARRPSSPVMTSGIPPTLVPTNGLPHPRHSNITVGLPSLRLGRTKTSAALIQAATVAAGRGSCMNLTWSSRPSSLTRSVSGPLREPLPTI